jgi:hypothetical protein
MKPQGLVHSKYRRNVWWGWGWSSVVDSMPSLCKALGFIQSRGKKEREREKFDE